MRVDIVRMQNNKFGNNNDTMVEAGIVLEDNEQLLDTTRKGGYYYCAVFIDRDYPDQIHFDITLDSPYEYLFGYYGSEDEVPFFIKRFKSLEEIDDDIYRDLFSKLLNMIRDFK